MRKSVSAAVRQIEDIRFLQESGHFAELGPACRRPQNWA
ncbi:MAG: hypothetical protein FRC54_10820 [bacterium LCO1.1]|uniref:Uncharacterized protein n=1 Tax=Candidatus Weimeria bifida TaxID=2599074 RepID=A0A6N7J1D0_9FIRM|nr:hypothetical protein [Candidatus Weimeria bifida]